MHELNFRNHFQSFFLLLAAVVAVTGASYVEIALVEAPIPVYILGLFTAFLVLSSMFYSKANIGETLQIAVSGILVNSICLVGAYYAGNYLNLSEIVLKPDFILNINPLLMGVSFVLSFLVLFVALKIEPVREKPVEEVFIEETEVEDREEQIQPSIENIAVEQAGPEGQNVPQTPEQEENQEQVRLEVRPGQKIPSTYEELYPGSSDKITAQKPEENELTLRDIPENNLQEVGHSLKEIEGQKLEEKAGPQQPADQAENIDFIPTNIRLTDMRTDRETESKGRIASIGKLLVNDRDIENVIETNKAVEEAVLNRRTNVISSISGEKIYNKFSELKKEFVYIKEVALIDKGGFVLANDFEDKQKAQITGALVSGAYYTLQNYLAQVGLDFPIRIFFETSDTNSFIVKTADEVLFSTWDKEFKHVDYGPLTEVVEAQDFSEVDITPYADLISIQNFIVTDIEGNILNSLNGNGSAQKIAEVASAILENLKVFMMNIRLINLSKIVIFTPCHVMTIAKARDKIISFITQAEEAPKISEELLKMEEIYE